MTPWLATHPECAGCVRAAPRRRRVRAQAAAARSLPAVAPPERPPITTHVLDMAAGRPAARVEVQLHVHAPGSGMLEPGTGDGAVWELLAASETGTDGRCTDLLPAGCYVEGVYRYAAALWHVQAPLLHCGQQMVLVRCCDAPPGGTLLKSSR